MKDETIHYVTVRGKSTKTESERKGYIVVDHLRDTEGMGKSGDTREVRRNNDRI